MRDSSLCIFCLKRDGGFMSEEHVIPESLGNIDTVLPPGEVCDRCNAGVLASCDQSLVNFPNVALMKTTTLTKSKKGKMPRMDRGDTRVYALDTPTGTDIYIAAPVGAPGPEDGRFTGTLEQQVSEKHMARAARSLLKAGLEMTALREGKSAALHPRWDGVRRAVLDGIPGLFFTRVVSKPEAAFDICVRHVPYPWMPRQGMGVLLNYNGVHVGAAWPPDIIEAQELPIFRDEPYKYVRYARNPSEKGLASSVAFSMTYEAEAVSPGSPAVQQAVREIEARRIHHQARIASNHANKRERGSSESTGN